MSFDNFWKNENLVSYFKLNYEDFSEPLEEYRVNHDGSLTRLRTPRYLGVKKNGKWGWIDSSERFVIPAIYDHGFVLCYDGVILLERNGVYGGLYIDTLTTAFQFKYNRLSYLKNGTYMAYDHNDKIALVRPGDIMLTSYKYTGFLEDYAHRITYVRHGFFGESSGIIDPITGRELS